MSLAYRFFVLGILFALAGMGLGAVMGGTQDFTLAPVHAHINLVGWATHFLFGLYYRGEPENAKGWLPQLHFYCAVAGGILLPIGIIGAVTGNATLDLFVIPGTLLTLLSMLLFLAVVIRGWQRHRGAGAGRPIASARYTG
jgi:FtsH-binding integral membrane protein